MTNCQCQSELGALHCYEVHYHQLISNQLKRKDQIRTMLTRSMQLMSDLQIVFNGFKRHTQLIYTIEITAKHVNKKGNRKIIHCI